MLLKLQDKLKPIIVDRAVRRLAGICIILNLAAWVLLVLRLYPMIGSGKLIALHYNVYLNVNSVGPAAYALVAAAIGTVILIVNFALATRSYGPSRPNTLVVLAITVFYEFLVLLSVFFIILINISR